MQTPVDKTPTSYVTETCFRLSDNLKAITYVKKSVIMRLSFIKLEGILLLSVGFAGLLFIMHGNKNGDEPLTLEKEEHKPANPSRLTVASAELKKLEWLPSCQENKSMQSIEGFSKLPTHIKDFLRYRHCKSFPQILNLPNKCGGVAESKNVFLLFAIKSSPGNYERRAIIRQTWGEETSYGGAHVKRIFLSGTSNNEREDRHLRQLLKIESQTFADILQWDFHDTFFNLTLKQFLFHMWLDEYCPGANFIFNGDDDVFVNTFNAVTYLRDHKADRHLFVGQLIANVGPIREAGSKYYVPVQVTASDSYPMYCGGGGILMSRYTSHVIHNKSQDIPLFPIDDVYLGMCLEKAGLVPASHMGMSTVGVHVPSAKLDSFNPCYYRELLMVHRFIPYQMLVMWKAIQDPHLDCGQKLSLF
ncbi:N-acetyllactosaminide beta-1,3-N-acetylglucosaminyltransferase 3-like isoform X2 [Hyla sarda]|uniref:N-acetyllactosaminide beta-1,3-N-acetylglucosaminyltransferase 3-like isoform X2 n=1 Tax=Hyla sarda TaxID=327740 RepID=UPI0024C40584|nr:N-acetyllactosaminide beta-1,3-N-acetylglucosaminyltransferase 3-like isoform X2 [Hyla sarda]